MEVKVIYSQLHVSDKKKNVKRSVSVTHTHHEQVEKSLENILVMINMKNEISHFKKGLNLKKSLYKSVLWVCTGWLY